MTFVGKSAEPEDSLLGDLISVFVPVEFFAGGADIALDSLVDDRGHAFAELVHSPQVKVSVVSTGGAMGRKRDKVKPVDTLEVKNEGGYAVFYINGRSLLEMVHEHVSKNPNKKARKHKRFVGVQPQGLDCYFYDNPSSHPEGYPVVVLLCNCGHEGCFDVDTTVTMDDATVTWRGVSVPLMGAVMGIGPFIFDREQYMSALGVEPESRLSSWS